LILAVERGGYVDAAMAFQEGNRAAADEHGALVAALSRTAGMAGDDSTATAFARDYDGAAREAIAGLADVVTAFAALGRLTETSLANHAAAEARSILPGAVVDDSCLDLPASAYAAVLPATPPSSLGGDPPALTAQEAWILDRIEGFVWPDADTARLRDAAALWRRTADRLDTLADTCRIAGHALATQRSPEIPLALAAVDDLAATIRGLAGSCAALGDHCTAHADAVEAAHAQLRALLAEILRLVVEGLVVSAVLGALSAGTGAGLAVAAVAARVATYSPRFHAILAALRALTTATAVSVRATHDALRLQRLRLERFLRVPARNERGALALGSPRWRRGWLAKHEHSGSHTLRDHVGRTETELREQIAATGKKRASSFLDQDAAERLIERTLRHTDADVQAWLSSGRHKHAVEAFFGERTGITAVRGAATETADGVRVVLLRDASMPDGYRILTSYPTS
jgi:hypothetical protein